MSDDGLSIGYLARHAGCAVQTVRHYERIGLLPSRARSPGGQRRYHTRDVERLAFIRHARELGFSLDDIGELLSLCDDPQQSCAAIDHVARLHLERVRARIRRLNALQKELVRMIDACAGTSVSACQIITVLADHSHGHCVHGHHDATVDLGHTDCNASKGRAHKPKS